jgi:hypothetical protein
MSYHGFPVADGWQRSPHTYVITERGWCQLALSEPPGQPSALVAVPVSAAELFECGPLYYLERRGEWIDSLDGETRWPEFYLWRRPVKPGEILSEDEMAAEPKRRCVTSP